MLTNPTLKLKRKMFSDSEKAFNKSQHMLSMHPIKQWQNIFLEILTHCSLYMYINTLIQYY